MGIEYPESWYAASCHAGAPLEALQSHEADADVCVIGGGYTGLSAALALAEKGRKVVLLEAVRIGWGASGRNGGQLIRGFVGQERMARHLGESYKQEVADLTWAGHDIVRERISKYRINCELHNGWLEVAPTKYQAKGLVALYEKLLKSEPNKEWQLYEKQELRDLIATDIYEVGLLSKADAHLHPLKLCLGMRDACLGAGVSIYENSKVMRIVQGAKNCEVLTDTGKVSAKHVVLAANAHHQLLKSRLSGYAYPAGSYIIATERLPEAILNEINPHGHAICDTKKVCDYFRTTEDGRVLFGGRVNYSGNRPKSIQAALLPRMLKVWPQLDGVPITHEWGGKLAVPVTEVPIVGQISDRIYYSFGYTGHGVNTGNLLGVVLAEAITGSTKRFDMFVSVPKWRLPFGRCIGQQMVAAAIFYYKITDKI
ncbi:NAD(P)/FAD-dependent oxidoreductase [Kordiimonas pumila]|uniref:NAD(P)/FAD-dependent oxidoreductase n=1 Tax=Kordiimonas pumila TaxID=2161677 RepID=A0ABV7D916_9PROT|nr:FAD-binding oxidoreductase [Kordiimonas pumila]